MDPCAQHDPIELPDTVQRPVTALSEVTNLGWGTKGFTPHASGLGCDKPAISDGGTARGDRRWTFLNVLFSDKRLIGTFVQSLVKNGRTERFSVFEHKQFWKSFFPTASIRSVLNHLGSSSLHKPFTHRRDRPALL